MKTIIDTKVIERAIEALEIGQGAFSQCFGGYGFYRPDNPHNFFPNPESCTPEEIANHSAACEAYDKGTYVPDHSDGWITPDLHVTAAPWGIGTYTNECQEIEQSIANLRAALEAKEQVEPVRAELMQAIARGWCYPKNSGKIVDPDLAEAIATEINKLYLHPPTDENMREDAERYRWLRHGDNDEVVLNYAGNDAYLLRNELLDQAIDAARAAEEEKS